MEKLVLWHCDGNGKKQTKETPWVKSVENSTGSKVKQIFVSEQNVLVGVGSKPSEPKKMQMAMIEFKNGLVVISP